MDAKTVALWMLKEIESNQCIYQDDIVDYLVKSNECNLLRENAAGNLVIGGEVLSAFKKLTELNVVWVKPERYWRFRVAEDDIGREARG